ncbi:MAG: DEAD/DEAH box helicase [Acetobacteraceae bacterium]|nr:DEAD/DEAH box helicase [Acetobacteraceae bacterium]
MTESTDFASLALAGPVLRAIATEGYETPTPIQARTIPHAIAGRDVLGIAQTGTGKTAAFALPILHGFAAGRDRLPARAGRALVLAPTRELATQIADSFRAYGRFVRVSVALVIGGASGQAQARALAPGVDVIVATPGRLLDHLSTGAVRLDQVRTLVLDEADHMLDLGFLPSIRKILARLPKQRQTLFFSATMPAPIKVLADEMLERPAEVAVAPVATTAERVSQSVFLIEQNGKRALLSHLLRDAAMARTLVFTRTKHGADRVVKQLASDGIAAEAIHGNKSQPQRNRALDGFRQGRVRVLVATDIAARGIDVDGVSHVVQFDLPDVPESYVHRIGRTARAGAAGIAIAFCASDERANLKDIERTIRQDVPRARLPALPGVVAAAEAPTAARPGQHRPAAAAPRPAARAFARPRGFRGRARAA